MVGERPRRLELLHTSAIDQIGVAPFRTRNHRKLERRAIEQLPCELDVAIRKGKIDSERQIVCRRALNTRGSEQLVGPSAPHLGALQIAILVKDTAKATSNTYRGSQHGRVATSMIQRLEQSQVAVTRVDEPKR